MDALVPFQPSNEIALAEHAAVIRALGKRIVGDVIEIGRRLADAKEIVGHGAWLPWLEREFGWSDDTALNYMRCAEMAESRNFRDLNLPVSGLYLLARPSTPEQARDEVISRAESGEQLSVKDVKAIVDEARRMQESEFVERQAVQELEFAERQATHEAAVRAEYVPGLWARKPPPNRATDRDYYLGFSRTKAHPAADSIPLMDAVEFSRLVKDIKKQGGLIDPIVLVEHEGEDVILDGRCREIACVIAGVEPTYRKIECDDPAGFIFRANVMRSSFTESQIAMADAMLTDPSEDEASDSDQLTPVAAARAVLKHSKEYADAVLKGNMQLWAAYDQAIADAWRSEGPA